MPEVKALSPGQTDSQVVSSSHKLNLRRDLLWVAKRTCIFDLDQSERSLRPLATPFGRALLVLELTCDDRDLHSLWWRWQICTQVDPSFSPFGHSATQANTS